MPSVYHASPVDYRDAIAREGLTYDPEEIGADDRPIRGVFAWNSLAAARRCASEYARIRETDHDIWEIIDPQDWQADPEVVGGVFTTKPVAPRFLRRVP